MTVAVGEAARQAVIAAALEHLDALDDLAHHAVCDLDQLPLRRPRALRARALCAARAVERGGDA